MRDYKSIKQQKYKRQYGGQWQTRKKNAVPPKSKTSRNQALVNERKKVRAQTEAPQAILSNHLSTVRRHAVKQHVEDQIAWSHRCHHSETDESKNILTGCLWAGASLCKTDRNGYSPLALSLMYCSQTNASVESKYCQYNDDIFGVFEESFMHDFILDLDGIMVKKRHSKHYSHLKENMLLAEKHYPNSWQELFGKNRCCLNLQNSLGNTILHYACLYDLQETVSKLLQLGADFTLKDMQGNQPLHVAVTHSSLDIIKKLLKSGANGFKKNRTNLTPLQIAIQKERADVVVTLMSHLQSHMKHHPLCVALANGSENIVDKILKNMTFENFFCEQHHMPILIIALMSEHDTEAEDCYIPFQGFFTSLKKMVPKKHLDVLFKLLEGLPEERLDLWIERLKRYKNHTNRHGNTLLHYACLYNSTFMVQLLLNIQAAVLPNHCGNTPLHLSCIHGQVEVMKLLLTKGVEAYARNNENLCPMSCACRKGKLKIVEILLEYGIHPNCTTSQCHHRTSDISLSQRKFLPINLAVNNLREAIPVLLQHGARVNFAKLTDSNVGKDTPQMMIISKLGQCVRSNRSLLNWLLYRPQADIWDLNKKMLRHLISAGAKIYKTRESMEDMINFERKVCSDNDTELIWYLLESGHRFTINLAIPKFLEEAKSKPYTLECTTAQTIRTSLMPNAWVAARMLTLPKRMKKYVVMNSSYVNL